MPQGFCIIQAPDPAFLSTIVCPHLPSPLPQAFCHQKPKSSPCWAKHRPHGVGWTEVLEREGGEQGMGLPSQPFRFQLGSSNGEGD